MADSKAPHLPTGRLRRLAGIAHAGVGIARGMLERDPVAPLARAVDTLSELRGLAAKMGQMGGLWSAMLPVEERARAEAILARLRAHTATSSPAAIRALVESELGAPLGVSFASFETEPFASASIGQVHRATLADGTRVAVKVQHPGIADALRADLANVGNLGGLASVLALTDARAVLDEVRARIEAELDYEAEARNLSRFAALFAGDAEIRLPTLVPERSSARVLTTHYVEGADVDTAARWPNARALGRVVRRFVRTSWIEHGLLFADPHAGNWIFHADGRVTVLDFGCVVPFEEPTRRTLDRALVAIEQGRDADARSAIRGLVGAPSGPAGELLVESMRVALAPLALDRPARADDLERVVRVSGEAKRRLLGKRMTVPPWLPLAMRALLGTIALLVGLEAR
jgi:predicted unusual protein kinase regulating ubiquinone biosynthesis (AarF/ABC1/UbiB family)